MKTEEIITKTLKEIIELIVKKDIDGSELINLYRQRIENINPILNAFITVNSKEEVLSPGKLFSVPVAFKDAYCTKGIKTTAASNILSDFIPPYDATVVEKIKKSGAYVMGKTNMDAWAHGSSGENSDFGPTKNPYNLSFVPGGSSSGSAAAVASSMIPVAFGTDTGGSIRLPSSFCNVVGIKPTYGRVSRFGVVAMASSFDSMGHITKTVYDNALILKFTAGWDDKDATSSKNPPDDYTKDIEKGVKGLKIGVPKEYYTQGLNKDINNKMQEVLKKYSSLGAEIIDISLPNTPLALAVYYILVPSEISSNLSRYDGIRYGNPRKSFSSEAIRRIILGTYSLSSGYYDAYYGKAQKVRSLISDDFKKVFGKVDCIIAPVSPTLPFKLGEKNDDPMSMYLSDIYTITVNLAGLPSLAVPAGFVNGLPTGFQIIGNYFSEKLLYRTGYAYERETEYYKINPQI